MYFVKFTLSSLTMISVSMSARTSAAELLLLDNSFFNSSLEVISQLRAVHSELRASRAVI